MIDTSNVFIFLIYSSLFIPSKNYVTSRAHNIRSISLSLSKVEGLDISTCVLITRLIFIFSTLIMLLSYASRLSYCDIKRLFENWTYRLNDTQKSSIFFNYVAHHVVFSSGR